MTDDINALPKQINDRLRAGAFVVVVKDADEAYARFAAEKVGEALLPTRTVPSTDDDVQTYLARHATGEGTLILLDFLAAYGTNPIAVRMLREVCLQIRDRDERESRLILVEHVDTEVPAILAGDVEVIEPGLPSLAGLRQELDTLCKSAGIELSGGDEHADRVAGSVAGLGRHEAVRLFMRSYVESGTLDVGWLRREKARRVAERLQGALTFEQPTSAEVGGLDELRKWLGSRRAAFNSTAAKQFGLPEPKGLLLLGTPGGGKSLTARTVAREWELPMLRLDAGKLFGSLVGSSEAKTRAAIEAAEACAPCVLWVDEIEKAFAGASGGAGDNGTASRVFGALLTWLQEKTSPVFVIATANRIAALPPELLRKGRFDEIFYIGLPSLEERAEILRIHLERRGREPDSASQLTKIAKATEGFSGAELEQAVVDALFSAYDEGRELELQDVVDAVGRTTPLSTTMREELDAMAEWAAGRARMASSSQANSKRTKAKKRSRPSGGGVFRPTIRPEEN